MRFPFFKKSSEEELVAKEVEHVKMIESLDYTDEVLSTLVLVENDGVFVPSEELIAEAKFIASCAQLQLSDEDMIKAAKAYGVFCDFERLKRQGLIESYGVENPLDLSGKFVVNPNVLRKPEFDIAFNALIERGKKNKKED